MLTQLEINMRDSNDRRWDHEEMMSGYPDCPYCGSDEGLNEDGVPCGFCKKGIALDREE